MSTYCSATHGTNTCTEVWMFQLPLTFLSMHIAAQRCSAAFSFSAACTEDTFTICLMFFLHLGEHPERGKKWWSMPTINPSSEEILTFLSRSWLGSPGASSPISNGLRNFCTKVGLIWKAWNASWNRNVSKCEIQDYLDWLPSLGFNAVLLLEKISAGGCWICLPGRK